MSTNSDPGWKTGKDPTAAEWAAAWAGKVDGTSGYITNGNFSGGNFDNVGFTGTIAGNPTFTGSIQFTTLTVNVQGVFLGTLILAGDPTQPLQASTKGYVDTTTIPLSQKGTPNGVATLDETGQITASQAPQAAHLKGVWNASTNTPTLGNSGAGGSQNDYYIVSVAGSTSIDGISSWALNDWIVNTGSVWTKQPNSGLATSSLTASDGSQIQGGTVMMPDLVWWRRDASGNILAALDYASTHQFQAVQVFGGATFNTLTGNGAVLTTGTVTTLTTGAGHVIQEGSSLVPDLAWWIRGDNGQITLAGDTTGGTVVKDLTVTGTLTASGTGGGASKAPPDALDITAAAYGGIGDGADDVFLGTWTSGAGTLSLIKYSGTVTWSGTTLTLTNLSNTTGPGFDPNVVGMSVYVGGTDGGGLVQTTVITGWTNASTVTVADAAGGSVTTANVAWPAFTAADVNKWIRVEGGSISNTRQAYNSGLVPWLGTIATVVDGHSVTVTGPVQATFSSTNNGRPCRISWGTDNSAAYIATQPDLAAGSKVIYHPRTAGRGKTVYCAFKLATRGAAADNFYVSIATAPVSAYSGAIWMGDPSVVGVLTDTAGRFIPKRLVPVRSPQPTQPTRDIIAKMHWPRVTAASTVNVVEAGDSLAKYDPTSQSDAWYQVNAFEWMLQEQNPKKTWAFSNIANVGLGWSEMVDPTSGTPTWVIGGTDLYYLSSSGNNDGWRIHPLKVMAGVNLALSSGNDGAGRPPDIAFTTCVLKGDIPSTANPGAIGYIYDAHIYAEVLLRTMAKRLGYGLVDLSWQSEQVLHGASNLHRELQELPEVNGWSLTNANPFQLMTDCYSWSWEADFSATGVWAALGRITINLSPMPGNVFLLDADPATGHLRYEGRLWGREVATTVSTSGATITTTAGTTLSSGTLTWVSGQMQVTFSGGGLTGRAGQCIMLPGLDISSQNERTYISQVINDTTAVLDDWWWGAAPGAAAATFSGTVTPICGGQMFIAADAAATADVVMTWGGTNVYRGQITGFTNANTATLSPAPPSLTGQAVTMWIGRASVPATVTTQTTTGNSFSLRTSFNKDVLSLRYNSLTTHFFKGVVERYGGRFAPSISISGAGPVTTNFINLYADRDVYFMPSGTMYDIWGNNDANMSIGGGGGHYPSTAAERMTLRAYEALDLCAV